jgi:hypothetical protein
MPSDPRLAPVVTVGDGSGRSAAREGPNPAKRCTPDDGTRRAMPSCMEERGNEARTVCDCQRWW